MLAQLKVREEKARFLIQAFKYAKNQATDILSSNPVQSYIQHFCSGESWDLAWQETTKIFKLCQDSQTWLLQIAFKAPIRLIEKPTLLTCWFAYTFKSLDT